MNVMSCAGDDYRRQKCNPTQWVIELITSKRLEHQQKFKTYTKQVKGGMITDVKNAILHSEL